MRFAAVAALLWLVGTVNGADESTFVSPVKNAEGLAYNSDLRLESHYLLYSQNCEREVKSIWAQSHHALRGLGQLEDEAVESLFGATPAPNNACRAVCLEKGTHYEQAFAPLPKHKYEGPISKLAIWIAQECQTAEIGFVNYVSQAGVKIHWTKNGVRQHFVGTLGYGEKKTQWHTSQLGHTFELEDVARPGEVVGTCTVASNEVCVLGNAPPMDLLHDDYSQQVEFTLSREWNRSRVVQRTFTELGFHKGRLPDDLWGSISAYYYNNKDNRMREEWNKNAFHVNWWQIDVEFIPMPWGLKTYWQTRLMTLVEEWVGVPLERTDIYGMRRYHDGARLLSHTDREATHACSLIINVDQLGMRHPWPLEIYDLADRLHEVYMEPGDIIYYESARCLHGRQQPMEGQYFVNLFAHYRPIGDPQWYLKKNPPGSTPPLIDIGNCRRENGRAVCDGGHNLPYLSPHLEKVQGPDDLFSWWQRTTKADVGNRKRTDVPKASIH